MSPANLVFTHQSKEKNKSSENKLIPKIFDPKLEILFFTLKPTSILASRLKAILSNVPEN